jgi:hypothetical protein
MIAIAQQERDVVRELARKVAEFAAGEENHRIIRRWCDVNALRKPDRAPVWCRPVACWSELLQQENILCADPYLRGIETQFRQFLIKREIDDDEPAEEAFDVPVVFDIEPGNLYGVDIRRHNSGQTGGSWAFEPALKSAADYDKLRLPTFTYNRARTEENLSIAHELLGDILPVRRICRPPGTATICSPAAALRGLTEILMDTVAEPELMRRLMAFLRDWTLSAMKQVEATGLLTPNNTGPMFCGDPVGPAPSDGRYTYKNFWCHADSQEFDQVSPAGWKEFCLDYQMPIMAQFGLVNYGCCENLTHKIDGVCSIPNLRLVTCSAWTNLDTVIAKCASRYAIMWRQKASDVVFPHETSVIRRDLEEGTRRLKGCRYQIVLRELQTLAGHPDRLHVWTRLAKEAADRHA